MRLTIFLITFLFMTANVLAQVDYYITTNQITQLDTVNVLIDRDYSFQEILSNRDLQFTKQSKIKIKDIDNYWIKCTVATNFAYDQTFALWTLPKFASELYYFDKGLKKWQSVKGGEMVANNSTLFKYMPCVFNANESTTFYVKVNVSEINQSDNYLKTSITFENEKLTTANRKKDYDWWLSTVAIVLAFLIYSLYWYIMMREKVYLYYLIMLAGGILYITSVGFFLSYFIPYKTVNAALEIDSNVIYTPIELLMAYLASVIVIYGLVQFTRLYLNSKEHFPQWDKCLRVSLTVYMIIQTAMVIAEYFKWINPSYKSILANNLLLLLILITITALAFKSYKHKIQGSNYFLSALLIPFVFLLTLVICLTVTQNNTGLKVLPNLCILSITITFGIILVAKVNLIKKELSNEKFEKQAAVAQNEIEKERNLRLQEKIEYDKNEVAAAQHIKLLMKELHHRVKNNLQIVSSLLSLQSFRIKDQIAIDAVKEGQHRIEAMSLIHQKLYIQDNITQVNIKGFITDIAESLMEAYGFKNDRFQLQLEVNEELIDVDKAIPLSIIINELITNAFKYAYNSVENPELKISFTKHSDNATLLVSDNGTGIDTNAWENNDGYGKELVQTFTEQLQGTLTLKVNNGTIFQIDFPY